MKNYILTKEEQDKFDSNENENAHTENLVFLASIFKREFPDRCRDYEFDIQAQGVFDLHVKIGHIPYALHRYRESLFCLLNEFITYE